MEEKGIAMEISTDKIPLYDRGKQVSLNSFVTGQYIQIYGKECIGKSSGLFTFVPNKIEKWYPDQTNE